MNEKDSALYKGSTQGTVDFDGGSQSPLSPTFFGLGPAS